MAGVKTMLDNYGFSEYFLVQNKVDCKFFPMLFKQRLIDNYSQEWNTEIEKSLVLQLYKTCKTTLSYENYLDMIPKKTIDFFITRMNISAHELRIQTGRFGQNRLPRNERYCLCCKNNDVEDEYHFILKCPCFLDIRKKFIKKYFS